MQTRFPTQFFLEFGRVDSISHIVAGSVCNIGDKIHIFSLLSTDKTIDGIDKYFNNINIFPLIKSTNIISISHFTFMENGINGAGMIFYKQPIANIFAFAINRERFSFANIIYKKRDKLFRELVRAIVIRAVSYDSRHTIGIMESAYEMVGRSLRSGIRAMRVIFCSFVKEISTISEVMSTGRSLSGKRRFNTLRISKFQCTIHLICRDMVK